MLSTLSSLIVVVFLLLSVAFFTLVERQYLGGMQRRNGPKSIGYNGLLQAIGDGVKLIIKESNVTGDSDKLLFFIAPFITFVFAVSLWSVVCIGDRVMWDFNF